MLGCGTPAAVTCSVLNEHAGSHAPSRVPSCPGRALHSRVRGKPGDRAAGCRRAQCHSAGSRRCGFAGRRLVAAADQVLAEPRASAWITYLVSPHADHRRAPSADDLATYLTAAGKDSPHAPLKWYQGHCGRLQYRTLTNFLSPPSQSMLGYPGKLERQSTHLL